MHEPQSPSRRPLPISTFLTLAIALVLVLAQRLPAGDLAPPELLADLLPGQLVSSSSPGDLVGFGGVVYFRATDPQNGVELWRSDGTASGTWLVADLCPGRCSSHPRNLVVVDDLLFFAAKNVGAAPISTSFGFELWVTDGTAAGTRMVTEFCTERCLGSPRGLALGGRYVFTVQDDCGLRLWSSDGTPEGTRRLLDSAACPAVEPVMTQLGDEILFGYSGNLWTTDGTPAGTRLLAFGRPRERGPVDLQTVGDRAFFYFDDSELWVSDGTTEGTHELVDLGVRLSDNEPSYAELDGLTYFRFRAPSSMGTVDQLWQTDGSPGGTRQVISLPLSFFCNPEIRSFRGQLLLAVDTDEEGCELWTSDGTEAGTRPFLTLDPGPDDGFKLFFFQESDELFFFARPTPSTHIRDAELWRTDGTPEGTRVEHQMPHLSTFSDIHRVGDWWLYEGYTSATGLDLFAGRSGSPSSVTNLNVAPDIGSSQPRLWLAHEGHAYLSAFIEVAGQTNLASTVWATEGRVGEITQLLESSVRGAVSFRDRVFLGSLVGLFSSDGTAAGTLRLGDVESADHLTVLGDEIYFAGAEDPDPGESRSFVELWRTDGTDGGTTLIHEIDLDNRTPLDPAKNSNLLTGPGPTSYRRLPTGEVLFVARDQEHGEELWVTDGTSRGTKLLVDLLVGEVSSRPRGLVPLRGRWLFAVDTDEYGRELWSTDGTPEGTRLLADLTPGLASSSISDLVRLGEYVYFFTTNPTRTHQILWRSDGSTAGTVPVFERQPGLPTLLAHLTPVGDQLYFVGFTPEAGAELWKSDGTAENTSMVVDLFPGRASSNPTGLWPDGDGLLFSASDGIHGVELWQTTGSAASTVRLTDLAPGPRNSEPDCLIRLGDRVLFSAHQRDVGRELWVMELPPVADGVVPNVGNEPAR